MSTTTALLLCGLVGVAIAMTVSPVAGVAFVLGASVRAAWMAAR